MFDKLIVSEPEGADFKNRRSYFLVSSIVVGIFFTTAVVISIFAAEIGLGNSGLELVEMIAPPEMVKVEPEPEQPRTQTQASSQVATRQANIAPIDEPPRKIPITISTTQNTQKERPKNGDVLYGAKFDTDPVGGQTGRNTDGVSPAGTGGLTTLQNVGVIDKEKDTEPPPVINRTPPPSRPVSIGVANGKATYLPKPVYSVAALSVHAQGKVDVQIMIDETGRVISANAVSGHPLLRANAEQAARNARFTPTLLSNVPVKVTGVIVYNFTR